MIQVILAPEPKEFDTKVRKKGRTAIAELVGKKPAVARRGPARKKIAHRESDLPPDKFPPYWREALPDLEEAYHRRCAFLALYLEPATGNSSVDHMLPKSKRWELVYEWSNYRLCAATINARKKDLTDIVDPFECRPGWFEMEFVGFQIIKGINAPASQDTHINNTLPLLNSHECLQARAAYVTNYEAGNISLSYLESRAPFIATELRRHCLLRTGDK